MLKFYNLQLFEIQTILKEKMSLLKANETIEFEVLNPDIKGGAFNGEIIIIDKKEYVYRSYQAWIDLSSSFLCTFKTPKITKDENILILGFRKLDNTNSFHTKTTSIEEKYGNTSIFSRINKNEEPSFYLHYLKALENVDINKRTRILNLGVNEASEFEVIKNYAKDFKDLELIGIDYCKTAISEAKKKFQDTNVTFYEADINSLDDLNLGEFDLIISIGTLQSTSLDFNLVFNNVVQKFLKKDGAMILGFPNCRWIDGSMIYGARAKNYAFSEMSLVFKDAFYCKKYLQQKKYRVSLTGKDYIFLTATSIRK